MSGFKEDKIYYFMEDVLYKIIDYYLKSRE